MGVSKTPVDWMWTGSHARVVFSMGAWRAAGTQRVMRSKIRALGGGILPGWRAHGQFFRHRGQFSGGCLRVFHGFHRLWINAVWMAAPWQCNGFGKFSMAIVRGFPYRTGENTHGGSSAAAAGQRARRAAQRRSRANPARRSSQCRTPLQRNHTVLIDHTTHP